MGPSAPMSLPALWLLGCFSLLLWLWVLCTACHRKQVQSHQAKLQDTVMLAESALLRQTHLCSLSTSDTRLHELHRGTQGSKALRPASMDLLHSHWLDISRSSTRPQAAPSAFPPQMQPTGAHPASTITLSIGPGATYSNVGLAATPRAGLAASPVAWAGTQLTTGRGQPGSGARSVLAEYASIQKLKGADLGSQELQHGKAKVLPSAQVDNLYSRVSKPKITDLRPTTDRPACKGTEAMLALESDFAYEPLPLRGLRMDSRPQENVYESIREVGTPGGREPLLRLSA